MRPRTTLILACFLMTMPMIRAAEIVAGETGGAMVNVEAITAFAVAVIGAVGMVWQRKAGEAKGRAQGEVTISGQPVSVKKVSDAPTWADIRSLETRVQKLENHLELIRREQSDQFKELLSAGHEREVRLREVVAGSMQTLQEKISTDIRAVHARVDEVIKGNQSAQSNQSRK